MGKKRRSRKKDGYYAADIIVAMFLGSFIGFSLSIFTGELLKPIVFYGDLILAGSVTGGVLGVIAGRMSAHWLEDFLEWLGDIWRWHDP